MNKLLKKRLFQRKNVIPAQAGIQRLFKACSWTPAFAGVTNGELNHYLFSRSFAEFSAKVEKTGTVEMALGK